MASRSLLLNSLKVWSKLQQVNTMMDKLATGSTLRDWAFMVTMSHTIPMYDITLLGFVPQFVCFKDFISEGGWERGCGEQRAGNCASNTP